jgi:flagellar assembly protein FliH
MLSDDSSRQAAGEPFHYAATLEESSAANSNGEAAWLGSPGISKAQLEKRDKESFERGIREGETRLKAATEARVKTCQDGVRKAVDAFQTEREDYFSRIEPEVVQLALAIAKKILHREAQIDPLLLTGLVHVALEKLDAGTHVRLRVPPVDTHFWNEFFARSTGTLVPELLGDPALPQGECLLETEIGSTQISLETQLKEIEQGFFDLLEQRPRVR